MSFFPKFERMIAWRYLFSRRNEAFISVSAILSFVGVMLGVMALIVVMSVMNGFRSTIITRILGISGHITVQPRYFPFKNYNSLVDQLSSIPDVTKVLPFISGQAFISGHNPGGSGVSVRGLTRNDFLKLFDSTSDISYDKEDKFDEGKGIYIGESLADSLGISLGDTIKILSPDGDITPLGIGARSKSYTVSAIFQTRVHDHDSGIIYMPLKEAQLYFNIENAISGIDIFIKDPDLVARTCDKIQGIFGGEVSVVDWRQRYHTFFSAMEVEHNVMFIILTLIVLVASLNIISGLVMLVKEKGRDIAILRTIGASSDSIMRIFFMIGAFIGFSGTCAGVLSGVAISLNIEAIRQFLLRYFGVVIFNTDVYFFSELPAKISWLEVSLVVIMAICLSFIATIFPSRRASRIDPVKALRYE
ncbi:lipoprotein-releasing ABC transporter permease subunit [Liberibacter sp. Z1]|nr:lipoprotein-releasing ABC transporter permease subunit [Candidatus Liberibacter sp.]